jgi:hypothetical protein
MNELFDLRQLEEAASYVREHLEAKGAPITLRNVVQAMFETHQADWIGCNHVCPQCDYETEANGL